MTDKPELIDGGCKHNQAHAKFVMTDNDPFMTAQELIDLLSRDPQAKVMIQVGDRDMEPLLISQISLNNEAHAWIIWEPEP